MNTSKKNRQSITTKCSLLSAGAGYPELESDWHLPSGKRLEEFALEGGYLASLLRNTASSFEWLPMKNQQKGF